MTKTDPKHFFITDPSTGNIRLTKTGLDKYQTRMAKIGYDIKKFKTIREFTTAADELFLYEMNNLAPDLRGHDQKLDDILDEILGKYF